MIITQKIPTLMRLDTGKDFERRYIPYNALPKEIMIFHVIRRIELQNWKLLENSCQFYS